MTNSKENHISAVAMPVMEWLRIAKQDLIFNMVESGYITFDLPEDFFRDAILLSITDYIENKQAWRDSLMYGRNFSLYINSYDFFGKENVNCGYIFGYNYGINFFNAKERFLGYLVGFIQESILNNIKAVIDQYIPNNTYNVWRIRELKRNHFYILEKGEDYRILEFYRLKSRYEPNEKVLGDADNIDVENIPNYLANDKDKKGKIIDRSILLMKTNKADTRKAMGKWYDNYRLSIIKESKDPE